MVSPPERCSGGLVRGIPPEGRDAYFLPIQAVAVLLIAFGSAVPDATVPVVQTCPTDELHGTAIWTWPVDPNARPAHEHVTVCPLTVQAAPDAVVVTFAPLNRLDVTFSDTC